LLNMSCQKCYGRLCILSFERLLNSVIEYFFGYPFHFDIPRSSNPETRSLILKIDISIGEVVDKITILSIKLNKIENDKKLKNIRKEYDLLFNSLENSGIEVDSESFTKLETINLKLWEIEDKIRKKEANKEFDDEFIQLARNVYINNDKRSAVKREINIKYGSNIIEEKEYFSYNDLQ